MVLPTWIFSLALGLQFVQPYHPTHCGKCQKGYMLTNSTQHFPYSMMYHYHYHWFTYRKDINTPDKVTPFRSSRPEVFCKKSVQKCSCHRPIHIRGSSCLLQCERDFLRKFFQLQTLSDEYFFEVRKILIQYYPITTSNNHCVIVNINDIQ